MVRNKYYNIYLKLKTDILNGDFKEGDLLPSENDLAALHSVSRETIRKALDYLSKDGLIQKIRGKGSMVLNQKIFNFPISGLTSFKELAEAQEMDAKTILLTNESIQTTQELLDQIKIPEWKETLVIERIRQVDGQNIILDYDYLDAELTGSIPDNRLEQSLYDYLENDLGLVISFANKEIVVENVTEKDRQHLDLREDDHHLVVIRSHVYLEDAQCFQFSESRHRLDKFRFMDFSRRKHSLELPNI